MDRRPHPAARRWAGNQPSCPQNKNKNQYQQLSLWTAGNGLFTVRQLLGIYWIHSHTWELSFFYRDETLTNFFFRSAVDIDNARCGYFYSNCFNRSTQLSGPWCLWQFFVKFISLKKGTWAKTERVQTAIIIRNADFIINWGEEERLLLSNKFWAH